MPHKEKRNPIDWAKHAHWFEAEGTHRKVPKPPKYFRGLEVITQDLKRADIVNTLCRELKQAGFTPTMRRKGRDAECRLDRLEEQKCYIERVRPHFMGEHTRQWAQEYLSEIKRREKRPTRPRKPFQCP